jgi:hypothetical protein
MRRSRAKELAALPLPERLAALRQKMEGREHEWFGPRTVAMTPGSLRELVDAGLLEVSRSSRHTIYCRLLTYCPHGNVLGSCGACDVQGDMAYDSAREDSRRFG